MGMNTGPTNSEGIVAFDPDELRDRYRRERDKRVRNDGAQQYVEVSGEFSKFVDRDPFAPADTGREPVTVRPQVVIIGGGFSGLLSAARLSERGITDLVIIEAGHDFGGTWYWNRYPGAQCDTDAYCYLPLLEELGYMPSQKYAEAPEIFEYSRKIAEHYGLYERALLGTRVDKMQWDETEACWRFTTDHGDDIAAPHAVMALGPISRPKLPGIAGIEDFTGHMFHSSRWDYDYTGGSPTEPMDRLADKRVAVIGTGASAVQSVPRLARDAAEVIVFQRTPSSVDFRRNKPTDPEWFASLEPGWQRARRMNFDAQSMGRRVEEDLIDDGWTDIFRAISSPKTGERPRTREERDRLVELTDFQKMEQIRARVDATVHDPATAEALKPWYRVMCKRPTFNDEFLVAFNQDNTTLVDVSETKGVERIVENGVVANGRVYEVDCIVLASGFETTSDIRRRTGLEVIGRDGIALHEYWADGLRTLHGFMTRGFPNWYFVGVSQNAFSVNMTSMFDDQARHIAYIIDEVMARGAHSAEPTVEGQQAWCDLVASYTAGGNGFLEACTPGYYNNEGAPRGGNSFLGAYTAGVYAFAQLLEDWRTAGNLDGLELVNAEGAQSV